MTGDSVSREAVLGEVEERARKARRHAESCSTVDRVTSDQFAEAVVWLMDAATAIRALPAVEPAPVDCPLCDHGPGCSPTYICEGCFHEAAAKAEAREPAPDPVREAAVALAGTVPEYRERGDHERYCPTCGGVESPLLGRDGCPVDYGPVIHLRGCKWVALRAAKEAADAAVLRERRDK